MAFITATDGVAPQITGAIRQAAHSTGISFEYLLTTAHIESNLNPAAQASTSSAKGLYQFIDQTWLATMKQAGAALGYGHYADAIIANGDGHYEVADPAMRAAIMRLRNDPQASAMMAGASPAPIPRWQLEHRPSADRRRALHRAFPRPRRRRQADQCRDDAAARQCRRDVSAGGGGQPEHFLRQLRPPRSVGEVYGKLTGGLRSRARLRSLRNAGWSRRQMPHRRECAVRTRRRCPLQ